MEWKPADSSMIRAYRWIEGEIIDGVEFGTLEIEWSNGTKGAYLEVNRRTFDDFETAKSRGRFLNSAIKPSFTYKRQEPENAKEGTQTASGDEEGPEA